MILRFLRLFESFRALEADRDATVLALRDSLQEETTQRLILQDRLDSAQESVSRLWGMVEESQNRAYRAMETQVNFATQQRFGITPYPEATHLPESTGQPLTDPVVARRMMPSEQMAAARARFIPELIEKLNQKSQ